MGCTGNPGQNATQSPSPQANATPIETVTPSMTFHPPLTISYEELLRRESLPPASPLPESEIANLIVSQEWLVQKDEDPRPDFVIITFPRDWLNKSQVSEKEPVALLRVPKRVLEFLNTNTDPGLVTIAYPLEKFGLYSNVSEMCNTSLKKPPICKN